MALSVGSAIYDPAHPASLGDLLEAGGTGMRPHAHEAR
jgi:hypothetical protein